MKILHEIDEIQTRFDATEEIEIVREMFDSVKLIHPAPRGLALQTRRGQDIKNEIALAPENCHILKYEGLRQRHPSWTNRKPACGSYNCNGHVFAARRTAIYEDAEVEKILIDDEYRRIARADASVGDVVIYRSSTAGLLHAAQIIEVGAADAVTGLRPIWALSKWDDSSGEDRHLIDDVPFSQIGDVKREVWTDRP